MVTFGKHAGKTFAEILRDDPDWFFWLYEQGKLDGPLGVQARELYQKATNIRLPKGAEPLAVNYYISQVTGKFEGAELVPESQEVEEGGTTTIRSDRIDLSFPRQLHGYDKTGCRLMVDFLRRTFFGENARITKSRIEAFFRDDSNFLL